MKSTCATSQIMVLAKKIFTAQVLTGTFDEFAKRKRKLNTTLFSFLYIMSTYKLNIYSTHF